MWTGTAPIGSSMRRYSSASVAQMTTRPATMPMKKAPVGLTH